MKWIQVWQLLQLAYPIECAIFLETALLFLIYVAAIFAHRQTQFQGRS